jgi:hypothetical protein
LIQLPIHDYLQLEGEVVQSIKHYAFHKEIHNEASITTATSTTPTTEDFHLDVITDELTRLQKVYVSWSIIFVLDFEGIISFRYCSYTISSQLELRATQEHARTKAILDKHQYHQQALSHYDELSDKILMYSSSYNLLTKLLILTPIVCCCACGSAKESMEQRNNWSRRCGMLLN